MSHTLAEAPVGLVPIVWNNVDLPDLAPAVDTDTILDETARLGYAGCQYGRGFPLGSDLRTALERRGLRFAERYVALPTSADGPLPQAEEVGRAHLRELTDGGGEVLVVALDGDPERDRWSGRVAQGAPRLTDGGWERLCRLLDALARETVDAGARLAFHAHTATWVEAPDELDRLAAGTDPALVGICLDVGHHTVGGGDPVATLLKLGERVTHLHLKDVDGDVLARLRAGEIDGFGGAVRERIFTELGNGVLDVHGILRALAERDYRGWIMIEQDSSWLPPSAAAAVGKRVYEFARRSLDR